MKKLPNKQSEAIHIGDGVYIWSDDGQGVWLMTERDNGWHEIYLEPAVYAALKMHVEQSP